MRLHRAYQQMVDVVSSGLGRYKWIANDYLTLRETETEGRFDLAVLPLDESDCPLPSPPALEGAVPIWDKRLLQVTLDGRNGRMEYRADSITYAGIGFRYRLTTIWGAPLIWIDSESTCQIDIDDDGTAVWTGGVLIVRAGRWVIAIGPSDGRNPLAESGRVLLRSSTAVAVSTDAARARAIVNKVKHSPAYHVNASSEAWNQYLESCPIVAIDELVSSGVELERPLDNLFVERQMWHWWAARANIVRSIADPAIVFIAPDRARWFGSWSSDAPITLGALSLTNDVETAAAALLRYAATSISPDGLLSWYTHADGTPGLGHPGDSGMLSQGLPEIVRAVDLMDRRLPGFASSAVPGRGDLYGLIVNYLHASYARDVNDDGLWETSYPWESGWDNKVSPLFAKASLEEWIAVLSAGGGADIASFVSRMRNPVTAMAEQVSVLHALAALQRLATRRGDLIEAAWAGSRRAQTVAVLRARQWNEATGTYRDWDTVGMSLADADCLDGFYFLEFEQSSERRERMLDTLTDPERFGLDRTPTLARDHPRFRSNGYWDGSHWPREMAYLARSLQSSDQPDLAARVLISALMSGRGSQILEHIDSRTGAPLRFHPGDATVYAQAMSVGLCIGLIEIVHGPIWSGVSEKAGEDV